MKTFWITHPSFYGEVEMIKDLSTEDFFHMYGLIIDDFIKFKETYPYKRIIDYFQYKLSDPYLANSLIETDFSISSNKKEIKDKEGIWEILCIVKLEKEEIILYCNGSLIWIQDLKENKKYLYYAD